MKFFYLLLMSTIIYAGRLGNHQTSANPKGETRSDIMDASIEDALVLYRKVEKI